MRRLFINRQELSSSRLGYVEVNGSLSRRVGRSPEAADLRLLLDEHWDDFIESPLDDSVMQLAAALAWDKRLLGADAIHLASADVFRHRLIKHSIHLVLVTADAEMANAARAIDLDVINPVES